MKARTALSIALLSAALGLGCSSAGAAVPIQSKAPPPAPRHAWTTGLPQRVSPSSKVRVGASVTSQNWSGYVVTGGTYSSVSASWVQPAINPITTGKLYMAGFWVGLDGWSSGTVEQAGTCAENTNGNVSYYAWYEMYPDPPVTIALAVGAGDVITSTVSTDGAGNFTITVANDTTGKARTVTAHSDRARCSSAEVITEAPWGLLTQRPLADFRTVDFTNCSVNGQAIRSCCWMRVNMVSKSDDRLATTSALSGDGAGFSVKALLADQLLGELRGWTPHGSAPQTGSTTVTAVRDLGSGTAHDWGPTTTFRTDNDRTSYYYTNSASHLVHVSRNAFFRRVGAHGAVDIRWQWKGARDHRYRSIRSIRSIADA